LPNVHFCVGDPDSLTVRSGSAVTGRFEDEQSFDLTVTRFEAG
jgi:hypothetical protein